MVAAGREGMSGRAGSWAETVGGVESGEDCSSKRLLVNEIEAARLLGISRRALFEINKSGEIPCVWLGRRKLYSLARLTRLAEGEGGYGERS